tara:strand:+ start:2048 stop:3286 length:1239 start_codon:yes stop_codon:yes gene_type:complete
MKLNHWQLSNGTKCVVAEMENSTLTCIDFWCKGGSNCESKDEEGMAHFLEHMIFKGSKNLCEGEFDLRIESLGGSSNAATGLDDVHYYVLIPSENIEEALTLLLDLLLFPQIEQDSFEIEKQVVLEEIAQTIDQPDEIIYMKLFQECCSPHRYSKPILGDKKSVENINAEQMKLFHRNNYVGENCTIAIAGKVPANIQYIINNSQLKELESANVSSFLNKKNVFKPGYKKESIPRLEGGRIIKAWSLPPAKDQILILGAEIVATLLCEGRSSIMIKRLREELRIVESIEIDLQILEEGGLILLEVCCSLKNIQTAEIEINNILNDSIQKEFSIKDIERAKKLVTNNIYFGLELSTQIASISGNQALWGRHQPLLAPIKDISYWTSERLNKNICPLFDPKTSYTLIAEPKKQI